MFIFAFVMRTPYITKSGKLLKRITINSEETEWEVVGLKPYAFNMKKNVEYNIGYKLVRI